MAAKLEPVEKRIQDVHQITDTRVVWLGPHQLNPSSKFYYSQLNRGDIMYFWYEDHYGNTSWWSEMTKRMKTKTYYQISLDRQLESKLVERLS